MKLKWLFTSVICLSSSFAFPRVPRWHKRCTFANNERESDSEGEGKMKELVNSLAQLAAIIMILITLAISTAAVSQWASAGGETRGTDSAGGAQAQTFLASDAR
jgi:hypothetical protein